jgi:hypothetical protein
VGSEFLVNGGKCQPIAILIDHPAQNFGGMANRRYQAADQQVTSGYQAIVKAVIHKGWAHQTQNLVRFEIYQHQNAG